QLEGHMREQLCRDIACQRGRIGVASMLVMLAAMAGCTTVMPPPTAGGENTQSLRAANLAPGNVGAFKLAPGKPAAMDKELTGGLRGSNIAAPSGSFSQHLRET